MKDKRVAIIDDESLVVAMLETWLTTIKGFRAVGHAHNGPDGLALCRQIRPDIVLLDVEMPGMNGLATARHLRADVPDCRIIVLTSHIEPYCIYEVSRLGVEGYVNKTGTLGSLQAALMHLAKGEHYYAPLYHSVRNSALASPDAFHRLMTPQQMAVLLLLIQGRGDDAIAAELGVAAATVATHRRNLRAKVNAHNDRDLLRYAQQWGLSPLQ